MTTRPEIAFEDLPPQSAPLTASDQILVSVGGTERRSPISLLPSTTPQPQPQPTIERYEVSGNRSPAAGSIAGASYAYDIILGDPTRISVARIVGFYGSAPHPAAITVLATIPAADYARAQGSVSVPVGVTLAPDGLYTLRLQVFAPDQQLTDEPATYADYQIRAQGASGAGLDKAEVDAEIRRLVDPLYLAGDTDPYPEARIPAAIARDAEVAAEIAAAGHLRGAATWSATQPYKKWDVAFTSTATYIALSDIPANTSGSAPGSGASWTTYWRRVGWVEQETPSSEHPLIERYTVTGDALPAAGSIAGDSYGWSVALDHISTVAAARIVGFTGFAPHPSSPTVLATIAEGSYTGASGTVTIPTGVSLTAGQIYTLRLEVYQTGQTPGTDQPYLYSDYQIRAVSATTGITRAQAEELIEDAQHLRWRGAWGAATAYKRWDVVIHASATYTAISDGIAPNTAGSEPGAGARWAQFWARLGYGTLPGDLVTETELATAIAPFRTQAQVQAAIAAAGHLRWYGSWILAGSYAINDIVVHNDDTFRASRTIGANTQNSEPGVGTDWTTYWQRLGIGELPSHLVTESELSTSLANFLAQQVQPYVQGQISSFRTADQIAALIAGAGHLRDRGGWSAATAYSEADLVWHGDSTYACITAVAANTTSSEPGTGAAWTRYWLRVGYTSRSSGGTHPLIQRYIVTGDATPDAGSIAGDDYSWSVGLGNTSAIAAARIVGFKGRSAPASPSVLATIGAASYASATGTATIPTGVTLAAAEVYTIRLEVYQTGQTPGTDHPYLYRDYQIIARSAPVVHPTIETYDVTGNAAPPPGSIAGDSYGYHVVIGQPSHASAVRIIGGHGHAAALLLPHTIVDFQAAAWHDASGTLAIPTGVMLDDAGDVYTLRLEVYESGQTPGTDTPSLYRDYRITATAVEAKVHFGVVPEADDQSDIVLGGDGSTDTITPRTTFAGNWVVAGVPADRAYYRVYFAVPTALLAGKTVTFSVGGINQDKLFVSPAPTRTIDAVEYRIYIAKTIFAAQSQYNGQTIHVVVTDSS